jgi:hypothetical protein
VAWISETGTWFDTSSAQFQTLSLAGGGAQSTYHEVGGFTTAPAGAAWAVPYFQFTGGSAGTVQGRIAAPFIARARAGQTARTPLQINNDFLPGADPTAVNTAAAISGQGSQATANAARGNTASRPASTGNYSWYANTETSYLQLDVPSVGWTDVAALLDPVAVTAGAKITSNAVYTGADGNRTTSAAELTLTGLTGTITYLWSVTEAGSSDIVVTSKTGSSSGFRWPSMVGDREVSIQCIVTANEGTFVASGIARWTSTS